MDFKNLEGYTLKQLWEAYNEAQTQATINKDPKVRCDQKKYANDIKSEINKFPLEDRSAHMSKYRPAGIQQLSPRALEKFRKLRDYTQEGLTYEENLRKRLYDSA